MSIEVVNTDQAAAWDGHEGDVWTEQAASYDRAGRRILPSLLEAVSVGESGQAVDIGCGTGKLSRHLARMAPGGAVTGVDLSTRMLDLARQLSAAEGLTNVSFLRGDAQVFPFEPTSFDTAVSSFGTMFFGDPVAAFANVARGLRPGGSLALLAWRSLPENEWLMAIRSALAAGRELPFPPPDAPTPFAQADPDRVRSVLGAAGFDRVELSAVDEPMDFGADASEALAFAKTMGIVEGLTDGLEPSLRDEALTNLAEVFKRHETPDGVLLGSAAWLITATRV